MPVPSTWRPSLILAVALLPAPTALALDDYPRDWGGGGKGCTLSLDRTTRHAGQASGTIRSTADGGYGVFTQWFQADKYRGKRLRLAGWIKTDTAGPAESTGAGLWMRVDGKERTALAFDNMMDRRATGKTDWKAYAVVLDIPDEAQDIFFGCLFNGTGQVWVDDLTFEVVGREVAPTELPTTPMPRQAGQPAPKVSPIEPKNTDFEF